MLCAISLSITSASCPLTAFCNLPWGCVGWFTRVSDHWHILQLSCREIFYPVINVYKKQSLKNYPSWGKYFLTLQSIKSDDDSSVQQIGLYSPHHATKDSTLLWQCIVLMPNQWQPSSNALQYCHLLTAQVDTAKKCRRIFQTSC